VVEGQGNLSVARYSPNDLRHRSFSGASRRSVKRTASGRARRLLWFWFKHESPILIVLNALVSMAVLALIILMTPIGGERVHWPDSETLEAYVGVALLAIALLKVMRARFARPRRSLARRISSYASTIAFALMGFWLLAVWFYESHSRWFFMSGILKAGGLLPADLTYFDGSIVPLLAPALAVLFGLAFSARQLKSIRRAIRQRKGRLLPFFGLVASACTLTIGAYAGDYRYFGWEDLSPESSSQNLGKATSYEPLFAAGVSCHVSDGFGERRNPFDKGRDEFHPGVDIAVTKGTEVHAMVSGTVIFAGSDRGFGNMVAIQANDGSAQPPTVVAAHMQRLFVVTGARVRGGELIGLAGTSGRSTGPHVHLQLCRDGHKNRSGSFVCGAAENPYESWRTLSAIARSSCAHGPIV
jgi:murein DD-endopeptidase MepM/ murein hydrolase activator NlpD